MLPQMIQLIKSPILKKEERTLLQSTLNLSRMAEIDLATDKFNWEKQNYGKEQQSKEKALESDLGIREKSIVEETKRAQIIQAEETRRAIVLQGMKQGLSAEAIEDFLKKLA